jgi:hypothetical protein
MLRCVSRLLSYHILRRWSLLRGYHMLRSLNALRSFHVLRSWRLLCGCLMLRSLSHLRSCHLRRILRLTWSCHMFCSLRLTYHSCQMLHSLSLFSSCPKSARSSCLQDICRVSCSQSQALISSQSFRYFVLHSSLP